MFERSLARTPGSFVQSLLAKVYMVQGEVERAKLLLAGVSAQNPLADVLFLRLHEKDGFMSEQMDRANRLKDPRFSLQREYYLSKIALQERHVDKAKYHFRRAQGLSEEFLPLKSLESRLYNE